MGGFGHPSGAFFVQRGWLRFGGWKCGIKGWGWRLVECETRLKFGMGRGGEVGGGGGGDRPSWIAVWE